MAILQLLGTNTNITDNDCSTWVLIDSNKTTQVGWSNHGLTNYTWTCPTSLLKPTWSFQNNDATLHVVVRIFTKYNTSSVNEGLKNFCGSVTPLDGLLTGSDLSTQTWTNYSGLESSDKIRWMSMQCTWPNTKFFGYSSLASPTISVKNISFDVYNLKAISGQTVYGYIKAWLEYTPSCFIKWYNCNPAGSDLNTYYHDYDPIEFPSPSETGYNFKGWHFGSEDGDLTTSYDSGTIDLYFYGEWEKLYRLVFFNTDGSIYDQTSTVQKPEGTTSSNMTLPTPLSMDGYVFKGWKRTHDSGQSYTIVNTNDEFSYPETISDSQSTGSATANGFPIYYYPVFAKIYNVIFKDASGNTITTSNTKKYVDDSVSVPSLTTANLNLLTPTGYYFIGWTQTKDEGKNYQIVYSGTRDNTVPNVSDSQLSGTGSGTATTNGFEIVYYPKLLKTYTVIFKDKNGNILTNNNTLKCVGDTVNVPSLTTTNLNLLTDTGYYFIGWVQTKSSNKNYLIAHTGTRNNTVPTIADSQLSGTDSGTATTDGFEIIYYPKLLKQYKIIFYNSDGTVNTTFSNKIKDNSITTPAAITRASYVFKGWTKATSNQLYQNVTTANIKAASTSLSVTQDSENGSATSDGFEIKYYGVWNPLYSIIYKDGENTIYTDTDAVERTMNYTVLGVTNANFIDLKNNNPSKQLLGWNTSSTATTTASAINSVTSNITLYAVWRNRDSLIFQENGTTITSASGGTVTGVYGNFTITGYAAVENGIYYYDQDAYQNCTYLLNTTNTRGKSVYISSVTTTSNLISGTKATDGRQWTATRRTATNGTAITINITLVKNALVTFFIYLKRRTDYAPSNFSSAFTITSNTTVARTGWSLYTQNSSNISADTAVPTWRHISRKIYMNPTDSVNFLSNCSDVNCYISRFLIPNGTSNMSSTWNPTQSVPSNLTEISRITAKTNASSNTYPKLADTNLSQSQQKGEYTFTATTAHMGTSISSNKNIKIYVEYEPFNCQFNITNINYTPSSSGRNINSDTCVTNFSTFLRIFNDTSSITRIALNAERRNDSSKYTISDVTINNESLDFKKNDLLYGTDSVNTFSVLTMTNDYSGNFGTASQDNEQNYYLNRFIGYHVGPNNESLITTYHEPYNINITWNNKDYKCFIILKLPVKNDDTDTTETDANDVLEKISFTGTDWSSYSDETLNRGIYIKELTDIIAATTINAVIQDIANSGYILKDIKKCSYNGNYNSTINKNTITREQLDSGSTSLPTGWTRDYSATSNDVLTLNENALIAGSVDYYFITYEEGLPIFYPNNENESKRAIQLYWEGVRAIGLYYENTRLL